MMVQQWISTENSKLVNVLKSSDFDTQVSASTGTLPIVQCKQMDLVSCLILQTIYSQALLINKES